MTDTLLERADRCAAQALSLDADNAPEAGQRLYAEAIACYLRSANAAEDENERRSIKQKCADFISKAERLRHEASALKSRPVTRSTSGRVHEVSYHTPLSLPLRAAMVFVCVFAAMRRACGM